MFEKVKSALCRPKRYVYFYTHDVLSRMSCALYGCFITENFDPIYLGLESEAEIYTNSNELFKIAAIETNELGTTLPFCGYAMFLGGYIGIMKENFYDTLNKLFGSRVDVSYEDTIIAQIVDFEMKEKKKVILVTDNKVLKKKAKRYGIISYQ